MAKKGTKNVRKRRTRPMKAAALVVSAIQNLRETNGSTFKKIAGYISYTSNLPEKRVKRQVTAALKRGVQYGILRRYRGHYFLPTSDELNRVNRFALKFPELSGRPESLLVRSKMMSVRKRQNRKKDRGIDNGTRKNTKIRKSCTFLTSTNPMDDLTGKIASDIVPVAENEII